VTRYCSHCGQPITDPAVIRDWEKYMAKLAEAERLLSLIDSRSVWTAEDRISLRSFVPEKRA
jgi:hypothetical protein